MDRHDGELSLRDVEFAEEQGSRDVGLPVSCVEESGSRDALVEHDVGVVTQLDGDAGSQRHEERGQRVAAMVQQLPQRRRGSRPSRLLPVAGIQRLVHEESDGEQDQRPRGYLQPQRQSGSDCDTRTQHPQLTS